MIVYGSRTKQLSQELVTDRCPNCGTQNSIDLHVFQKYAHVFWIPFFPMGKTAVSQCGHCKQVLKLKEMPSTLTSSYESLKARSKTPIWTFSGLALVAILISVGVYSDKKKDEKNATLILTPQSGDVYSIKMKDNQYTLYKVETMQGDSALICVNQFESNKISGLADLKKKGPASYAADTLIFAKSDLKTMLDKGEIIDIDRQ